MNTLRSPIVVSAAAAARAAVNRHELAENVAAADDEARLFSAELQILRREADRRERIHLGLVADLGPPVDDGVRADGAVRPDAHVRTNARMRADRRPLADARAGMNGRGGSIRGPVPAEPEQQFGLGDDLIAHKRRRLRASQRRPALAKRDLEPQPIAGNHLPPELGVVHAA